jgi:hypothetical protein
VSPLLSYNDIRRGTGWLGDADLNVERGEGDSICVHCFRQLAVPTTCAVRLTWKKVGIKVLVVLRLGSGGTRSNQHSYQNLRLSRFKLEKKQKNKNNTSRKAVRW